MFRKKLNHIYDQLLNDNVYKSLSNNDSRIRHILNKYISKTELEIAFPERIEIVISKRKSMAKSNDYYNLGEAAYAQKDDEAALIHFDKAILFAPHNTIGEINYLIRAFISRSKTLFRMDYLVLCLFDIQQAINLTDTEELRNIRNMINDAIDRAKRDRDDEEVEEEIVERELLDVYDECTIQQNVEFGRYMEANGVIEKDEVFIKEKAQYTVLKNGYLLKYCFKCFKDLTGSQFYPCENCVDCIFCSKTCADEASNGFHQFDCGIAGHLSNFNNWNLGYRALTSLGYKNVRQLDTIVNENNTFKVKEWHLERNHSKEEVTGDQILEQFRGFLSFEDHINLIPIEINLKDIFTAFEIALLIEEIKGLNINDDEDFILLSTMLIKVYRKVCYNCFSWQLDDESDEESQSETDEASDDTIGYCICLVSTMINHSCVPNAVWQIQRGFQNIVSLKKINPEDEITITYGMYDEIPFLERQTSLRNHYFFTCDCNLCSEQKHEYYPLKCLRCGGTVYYGIENESNYCVDCTEDNVNDEDYFEYCVKHRIPLLKSLFKRNIAIIESPKIQLNFKVRSLRIAEGIVETISKTLDKDNDDLIEVREELETARQLFP